MRRAAIFAAFLVIGVALSLFLGGCASLEERPVKTGSTVSIITLERTYAATEECSKRIAVAPGWKAVACAEYGNSLCKITMHPAAPDDILGHEARHCFDGSWHR